MKDIENIEIVDINVYTLYTEYSLQEKYITLIQKISKEQNISYEQNLKAGIRDQSLKQINHKWVISTKLIQF